MGAAINHLIQTHRMEEQPFPDLKIESGDFLGGLSGRSKCPKCLKSRKYYCYTCYLPVAEIADRVPKLKLPIKVDIIKHPSECDGKSTAVHAGVICPEDVRIFTYPCIPDYISDKTLLVFPGDTSVTLEHLAEVTINKQTRKSYNDDKDGCNNVQEGVGKYRHVEENTVIYSPEITECCKANTGPQKLHPENGTACKVESRQESIELKNGQESVKPSTESFTVGNVTGVTQEEKSVHDENNAVVPRDAGLYQNSGAQNRQSGPALPFHKVVFIDSTWNQTKTICNDERLKDLQRVELRTRKTKFWRHQDDVPDTYLSTIEAIYYFMRDFHEQFIKTAYIGEYDNLLFFFAFMYSKIRTIYDGGNDLRAYKKRKLTQN